MIPEHRLLIGPTGLAGGKVGFEGDRVVGIDASVHGSGSQQPERVVTAPLAILAARHGSAS
jgi:hypothetical protein